MLKKGFIGSLIIIFIFIQHSSAQNLEFQSKKDITILIIQSYNDEYSWTRDIMSGMRDALKSEFFSEYDLTVRVEYMDAKNYNQIMNLEDFKNLCAYKYQNMEIDYILAADDAAFKFALDNRKMIFSNAPIFFCGINSINAYEIEKLENIYGIIEKASAIETLEVALKFTPTIKKIHLIIDSTDIGVWTKKEILDMVGEKYPEIEIVLYENQSLMKIQEQIANIDALDEIVFMGFFAVDPDEKVRPVEKSTQIITQASKIPVYGLWSFNFPHGIIGGKLISGYDQGKRAVELFNEYLECEGCMSNYFIEYDQSNKYMYDYEILKKFNYDISKLPKDSLIINVPEDFYTKYKQIIWGFTIIFLLGIIYIFILKYQIKIAKNRMENANKKLIQSEKLASLGNLVRGLAHEMNTPLGNAISLSSLMQESTKQAKEKFEANQLSKIILEHYFEKQKATNDFMDSTLSRLVSLINAFKSIAIYAQSKETEVFSLNRFFEDFLTIMQLSTHHKIDIEIIGEIAYKGNTQHFYTIFYELVKNSINHAFTEGQIGQIQIKIEEETDWINIYFSDNGKGILKENINKMFDPFFTTSWGGEHSGLGLFNIYNIIASLGGNIEIQEDYTDGTAFIIKLPKIR